MGPNRRRRSVAPYQPTASLIRPSASSRPSAVSAVARSGAGAPPDSVPRKAAPNFPTPTPSTA
eukprot:gene22296-16727_t